uniref:RNA-dependent RNA polymerase n=1 Tax=Jiangxia Mosquito Virus 2 TaxID=1608052 RepID=A0A0B5KRW6_9VIRU|nr:RNA-dependent RNA polymerase [Jiangxia Mosquito Virus 2]
MDLDFDYENSLNLLERQYDRFKNDIGIVKSDCKNGGDVYRAEYNLTKLRHEAFCLAASNRQQIEFGEKKIRDSIAQDIPFDCYQSLIASDLFKQTPDLLKRSENRHNGMDFVHYKWIEVAMTTMKFKNEVKSKKEEKYYNLINVDVKNYLEANKSNMNKYFRTQLVVVIVNANLSNWSTSMSFFGSPTDLDFEEKCYNLANRINNRLLEVQNFLDNISKQHLNEYFTAKRKEENVSNDVPLTEFKPDLKTIKERIDNLPRSTKHLTTEIIEEEDLIEKITNKCLNWYHVNENYFTAPSVSNTTESFQMIERNVIDGDFEMVEDFDKMAPTFHFMYKSRDHKQTIKFENAFNYMIDVVKMSDEKNDNLINLILDLNIERFTEEDKNVFFAQGYIDDWKVKKKLLSKVQEPKTVKWSSINKSSRHFLKENYGIKSKKELLKERKTLRDENVIRRMKAIDITKSDVIEDCEYQISKKRAWLVSKRNVYDELESDEYEEEYRKGDEKFNRSMDIINSLNCEELSKHIQRVSSQMIFKSNSTGHGVHVIYTGNRDVWVFTLPGGDITNKEGDIRFFTLIIDDKFSYAQRGNHIFNSEIIENRIEAGSKILLVSKVYNLNRQRWEHMNSVDPGAFSALVCSRFGFFDELEFREKFSGLIFAYYYNAFGCQAKLSSLVDHFRYMIPASLASKSALTDYIESKLNPVFKTAGQVWIYNKLKNCCLKYLEEGKDLKMNKEIRILDEEFDDEDIGLTGQLSSLFIDDKWKNREGAMSEVYIAFHLTGKGYHNPFHRDVGFVKTVMGNEIEYNELYLQKFTEDHLTEGIPIDEEDKMMKLLRSDRGGLFCKEAVMLSAQLASAPAVANPTTFCKLIEQENMTKNILYEKKLTSTKSSLTSRKVGKFYKYNASQTMLQTTLDEIKEEYKIEMQNFEIKVLPMILQVFNKAYEKAKEENKLEEQELKPEEVDEQWHGSVNSALIKEFTRSVKELKKTKCFMTDNKTLLQQIESRLQNAKNSEEYTLWLILKDDILSGGNDVKQLFVDENPSDSLKIKLSSLNTANQKIVWDTFMNELKLLKGIDILEVARSWEANSMNINGKVKDYLLDYSIKKNCVLYMSLKHLEDDIISKIVPKGQRTDIDREIFVQNSSRYIYYVMEHYFAALCKMNPMEAISLPGDEKMKALKRMVIRAFKWKQKDEIVTIAGKDYLMKKRLRFVTGDLQKFSNHDTDQRLAAFAYYTGENLKGDLNKYVYLLTRLCSRKQVLAPATLCVKEMDKNDPILKLYEKNKSNYPLFNAQNCNWFQGMRNFESSCCHVGVAKTIKKVFSNISKDLYYDSLVHSDDFASVIGYVDYTPLFSVMSGLDFWTLKYEIRDVEDFCITTMVNVYKLNNLHISRKKTSISTNTIEFVSYLCMGGSVYMGFEKQLFALYSEKTGKGPREDTVAVLSQASGAIMKGCPSFVVDVFLDRALEALRNDYSMNTGMRFDPVKEFNVPRDMLPLAFIPKIKRSALSFTLTKPELHDIDLLQKLNNELKTKNLSDDQEQAVRLLMAMSCKEMGKINMTEIENKFEDIETVIPGIKFRGKNNKEVRDKLKVTSWLDEDSLRIITCMDESTVIVKPKDTFFLLVLSLLKLCSNEVINGMSSRNKLSTMRMKADFKNKEVATLNSFNQYTTLEIVYKLVNSMMKSYTLNDKFFDEFENLTNQALFIHNASKEKMNTIINSEIMRTDNKVRRGKDLVRLPVNDSYKLFVNKTSDLILSRLFPGRCILNDIEIRNDGVYTEDVKRLKDLLDRNNFLNMSTPYDRMRCLEMILKYSPDHEKSMTIVTTFMKGAFGLTRSVRHLLSNNLHPIYRMQISTSHIVHARMNKRIIV